MLSALTASRVTTGRAAMFSSRFAVRPHITTRRYSPKSSEQKRMQNDAEEAEEELANPPPRIRAKNQIDNKQRE